MRWHLSWVWRMSGAHLVQKVGKRIPGRGMNSETCAERRAIFGHGEKFSVVATQILRRKWWVYSESRLGFFNKIQWLRGCASLLLSQVIVMGGVVQVARGVVLRVVVWGLGFLAWSLCPPRECCPVFVIGAGSTFQLRGRGWQAREMCAGCLNGSHWEVWSFLLTVS